MESIHPQIRPMALEDLEEVLRLERRSFAAPWDRELYLQELRHNRHSRYRVAVPGPTDPPVQPRLLAQGGYMLLGQEVHIMTLAVQPEWRRRGLGRWLLLSMLEEARAQAAPALTLAVLEVRPSNRAARELYRSLGFQEVGYRRRYYPDREDALVLMLTDLHRDPIWEPLAAQLTGLRERMARGIRPHHEGEPLEMRRARR